ncbi:MAG: hypothetical protein ACRC1K_10660 [Planctomycetia bacterium]
MLLNFYRGTSLAVCMFMGVALANGWRAFPDLPEGRSGTGRTNYFSGSSGWSGGK